MRQLFVLLKNIEWPDVITRYEQEGGWQMPTSTNRGTLSSSCSLNAPALHLHWTCTGLAQPGHACTASKDSQRQALQRSILHSVSFHCVAFVIPCTSCSSSTKSQEDSIWSEAGVSILMSYGVKPHYVKLPIFSEFMENSAKFIKNSGLTEWTQNLL